MIRVVNATKAYGPGGGSESARVHALNGVSLEIAAGEFVAIMGPSGCGKSTLLHVLGGLDVVNSGEVFLDGEAVHQMGEKELTRLRRDKIGFVFQAFNLLPTLSVEENVELPGLLRQQPIAELRRRSGELLEAVGLSHRARHGQHQLSGGEMQRAALARALLLQPPVVLADEPTGNLDSEAGGSVVRLFREIGERHKTTIVMVTHSREIASAAHRVIEMRDGRVVG